MSILNVNKINPVGGGSTITIAGIASVTSSVTAPSFVGNLTGTATGLNGTPNISVGTINASSATITGGMISAQNSGAGSGSSQIQLQPYGTDGYINCTASNNLYTRMGTGFTIRTRIDGSGNFHVNSGNLVIGTSGKGIDFSATSDASGKDSELLDDYEEGLFTPTVAGSSGSATVTYQGSDNRRGRYVKIGKMVHVNCLVGWNNISNGFTGNIRVGGLPFAHEYVEHADPNDYTQSVGSAYYQNLTLPNGNDGHAVVYIWGGYSTYVNLLQTRSNSALAFVDINAGNNSSSSAIKYIQFSLSYPAA